MSEKTKQIDYRTTTAPTDWLAKRVARYDEYFTDIDFQGDEFKTGYDYVKDFVADLSRQRCEPNCSNGNGSRKAKAVVSSNGLPGSNGQPTVDCICSLLEQMSREQAPLVAKGEFVAVVEAAGYNREQALRHYQDYAWTKLNDQHKHDLIRLMKESHNAHNWWLELSSHEACSQSSKAEEEIRAIVSKIDQKLEAIMSA